MKLSLAWIFDHLVGSWKDYAINDLVDHCIRTTAEIDYAHPITIEFAHIFLVRITTITPSGIEVFCSELNKEFRLSFRSDGVQGGIYAIKKEHENVRWTTIADWAGSKEGLLPAVFVDDLSLAGSWKDSIEDEDYILEVDNKSITNRPDLWCHRGFARELGAMLQLSLKPEELFYAQANIKPHQHFSAAHSTSPISLSIDDQQACKRFAGLYFNHIACRPSSLFMTHRLVKIDARPHDVVVDATNYVMFDIGQPLHAFDASKIQGEKLVQRRARKGEKLTLLDGQLIELTDQDMVVADAQKPVALAGIMGGLDAAVSNQTTSILLEAANYDATAIRMAAMRHKKRTEASTRFEKSLDPHLNTLGIKRLLKILENEQCFLETSFEIQSLGFEPQYHTIEVEHEFIESRLGLRIDPDFVITTLKNLEFKVTSQKDYNKLVYTIGVPTFRATKDIIIKEDIVEEIGRFFGYGSIPLQLPSITLRAYDLSGLQALRRIKQYCAYTAQASEVYNYAFFDEEFLPKLGWEPMDAVSVQNPVSQHWRRLVTSLVPHLFKNIVHNSAHDHLRFFEVNTIWNAEQATANERKSCAGIFYDKHKPVDFYESKSIVQGLFDLLHLDVQWVKATPPLDLWYHPYQTARLECNGTIIGYAGTVDPVFLSKIGQGHAFVFELTVDLLLSLKSDTKKFEPLPKYPAVFMDISFMVPLSVTIVQAQNAIAVSDKRIVDVALIDMFQKPEWHDKKSLAFRYQARDQEKTLSMDDCHELQTNVANAVQKALGAVVR